MFCLPHVVHYIIQINIKNINISNINIKNTNILNINILNTEYVVALRDKANHERISTIEGSRDRTKVGLLCRLISSMSLNIVYVL